MSDQKPRGCMVIVYMDSTGKARYTGLHVQLATTMETWLAFTSYKQLAIPHQGAPYVVGYYNSVGVLFDTIGLSAEGFERITKQKALTEEQWLQTDALIREAMQGAKRGTDVQG